MAEPLHQRGADPASLGDVVEMVGELYLVILAVLILLAALAEVAGPLGGIIVIEDPAIAAAFTA